MQAIDAGDGIEQLKGIICPGFINTHCHLELSHLHGVIPQKTGLPEFVFQIITGRHFEEAQIVAAIEKAEAAMLQNGIVAVGDICNTIHTLPQKAKGNLYYHNFIEVAGFPPAAAESRFKQGVALLNQFSEISVAHSIVPHAPYSVSPQLMGLINNFPGNHLLSIHNQEALAENELFLKGTGAFLDLYKKLGIDVSFFTHTGKSSVQSYLPFLQQQLILVHNVITTKEDVLFVQQQAAINNQHISFCLCACANLYITGMLPDVTLLQEQQCPIVLGTDSLASNQQLCILSELKILQQAFPSISLKIMLQWATLNGARALNIEKQFGSFVAGKKPGVLLLQHIEDGRLTAGSIVERLL
jgi:aminodeoxyfutalosine deaminase